MRVISNILWIILGGLIIAIGWALIGLVLCGKASAYVERPDPGCYRRWRNSTTGFGSSTI